MPRIPVRVLPAACTLAVTAAVIPLGPPASAVADSIIVGGQAVPVEDSPWAVALSSRDRFGGTRAGQFCGGVAIATTKVLTAAHCLREDVLGSAVAEVTDLRIIAGRDELDGPGGRRSLCVRHGSTPATTPTRTRATSRSSLWTGPCPRAASFRWQMPGVPRTSRAPRRRCTAGGYDRVRGLRARAAGRQGPGTAGQRLRPGLPRRYTGRVRRLIDALRR